MSKAYGNIYSGLFAFVCALLILFLGCFLLLALPGLKMIWKPLAAAAVVLTVLAIAYVVFLVVVFMLRARAINLSEMLFRQAWLLNSLLFPIIIKCGQSFGYSRDTVMRSFIGIANRMSQATRRVYAPERILLLLPHCIQLADCKVRISTDVSCCLRCGRCKVAELLKLSERYGILMTVVTGGTLARKKIRDLKPQAVLAVACERDLTSGLQDVFPLPAIGILNKRPYGPCFNTDVDVAEVEARLVELVDFVSDGSGTDESA